MDTQQLTGGGMGQEAMDSRGQQRKRLKINYRQLQGESVDGSNMKNPLLIDLVLEKVFSYSKRVDPDNFKNYRLVCKLWDAEVLKLLRPDTKMNLCRIIFPYPEGLGWTDQSGDSGYQAPYPFENVVVTGTCDNLMDPQMTRWFETKGSNVKQLQFSSRLTCYHHVRFLECLLKNWCPNLTQLSLTGVDCIYMLVNVSRFVDPTDIICTNLNELIVSVVNRTQGAIPNDCREHLPETYLTSDGLDLERGHRQGYRAALGHAFMTMISDTPRIVDYLTRTVDTNEEGVAWGRYLELNNGGSLIPPTHQHVIQEAIRSTDGGVLGELLKSAPITKLALSKADGKLFLWGLFPLLYCRPNTMRQTLSKLTIREESNDEGEGLHIGFFSLRMIRTMRYPLVTLNIGPLRTYTIRVELVNFVWSFSETLEHLAIKGRLFSDEFGDYQNLNLPLLPKLKTFLNEDALAYRLTEFDFLGSSMPNLERCELRVQSNSNPDKVEEMTGGMFRRSAFEDDRVHPLKEIKMDLRISVRGHVELMTNWFPGLVKVDLVLIGGDALDAFFRMTNHLSLEDVKVSFQLSDNGGNDYENAIVENMIQNENLQFLQLVHLQDWPAPFSERALELGFAKAPKLTSLKLKNVRILASKHRVRDWLSHISCVQFSKVTFQRRQEIDELDFSLGRSHF